MAGKLRGVYLNQPKAKCSIYESGQMVFNALQLSDRFSLEYFALDPESASQIPPADFYLFNYHHATMAWLDTNSLKHLPGKKITVVLEMLPGNPFVYISPDIFDAYLVLDPTMDIDNSKVYGFPRPLEEPKIVSPYVEKEIPWIGTFGFSTPGKGFELVVDAVNREFDRAVVRINIPPGTFADDHAFRMHKRNYAEYLSELCSRVAKPGIEVRLTRDFMSKEELIEWCAQNTLNCFLYARNQPGLSATTDQCITTGRPLAVSANETFRHLHQYIRPYPEVSLRESIANSIAGVQQMREDWTPRKFSLRMEKVLSDLGLLVEQTKGPSLFKPTAKKQNLLVVSSPNSTAEMKLFASQCAKALGRVSEYRVVELCSDDANRFSSTAQTLSPTQIVLIWEPNKFDWLTNELANATNADIFAIVHPGLEANLNRIKKIKPLFMSPAKSERTPFPRVLPLHCNELPIQDVPAFAVPLLDKGIDRAVDALELVQNTYDSATILFYLPNATASIHPELQRAIRKPGISLSFVHQNYETEMLFTFFDLASATIFIRPTQEELIFLDHSLSSQRPVAIISSAAIEFLRKALPNSFLDRRSLREIIADGIASYVPIYNDWSEARFLQAFREAVSKNSQVEVRSGTRLNRLIRESERAEYFAALEKLQALAGKIVSQTEPDKVLVHAFVLDTVERFAKGRTEARILAIEAKNDPAVHSLRKLGYALEEIDSARNFSLDSFYYAPTTAYQSYDIIFASTALDRAEDPEMFLAQVGDLLAPGGVAILACAFEPAYRDTKAGASHAQSGLRVFHESDFRERFLPLLQGCKWADAPSWNSEPGSDFPTYATLVIAKSGEPV